MCGFKEVKLYVSPDRNSQSQALWRNLPTVPSCSVFPLRDDRLLSVWNQQGRNPPRRQFSGLSACVWVSHNPAVFFPRSLNCLRNMRFGIFPYILAVCTQKSQFSLSMFLSLPPTTTPRHPGLKIQEQGHSGQYFLGIDEIMRKQLAYLKYSDDFCV